MTTVLIIDDEEVFAQNVATYLERFGHCTALASSGERGIATFERGASDLVLVDFRLPDCDGLTVIRRLRELDPDVPIVMITGHGSIELAVKAMQLGACDLITKPVSLSELRTRIERFAQTMRQSRRLRYFDERVRQFERTIIGSSPAMNELRKRLHRLAEINVDALPPVLIQGETGTGKELVARALHFDGPRSDQPFIELNCAAIPENLLEAELFGYERGAFTDAKARKIGLLEAADRGTLFLDEIGEMGLGLQAKLLKVIEDGRFRRLGSLQERQLDLRIVAATHQDLEARIADGQFRADLYFRLRVLHIAVPPLREREGDALELGYYFLEQCGRRYGKDGLRFSEHVVEAIARYSWPGNVRELRNVIEQAVLLCNGNLVSEAEIILPGVRDGGASEIPITDETMSRIDRMEREMLIRALDVAQGNVSGAARELGISRDRLRYRMEKFGLRAGSSKA